MGFGHKKKAITLTEGLIITLILTLVLAAGMPFVNKSMVSKPGLVQDSTPPGVVSAFAGKTAPNGWLLCDGTPVSRTTYPKLYEAIGSTYGNGNGSTTFNLPDLRGYFIRGWDPSHAIDTDARRTFGATQQGAMPEHKHSASVDMGTISSAINNQQGQPAYTFAKGGTSDTTPAGAGNDNHPINRAMNYIIKF